MSDEPGQVVDAALVAKVTAQIARIFESVADVDGRIGEALNIARRLIPCDRLALMRVSLHYGVTTTVAPEHESHRTGELEGRLQRQWLRLVGGGAPGGEITVAGCVALPIVTHDAIVGLLGCERDDGHAYEAHHLQLMASLAAQVGSYLTLVRAADTEVHDHSGDDALDPVLPDQPGETAARQIPLTCPGCGQQTGFPYRARTKCGDAGAITLGSRCRSCGHEWDEDVSTAPGFLFRSEVA